MCYAKRVYKEFLYLMLISAAVHATLGDEVKDGKGERKTGENVNRLI